MEYRSTRNNQITVSAAEAILKGISPDGGLFVPTMRPRISMDDIVRLAAMGYRERACGILGLYLTDFTSEEISDCVSKAYNKERFETDSIAPLYGLSKSTYILELWHGPTSAFKDMALQILPHLLTLSMKKMGETREVVILVATSGDTGKAALEGFRDVAGTKIMVFFPEEGVSNIQRLQMLSQEGNNVGVASVYGNFDDAQSGVKKIFTDVDFQEEIDKKGFVLSSANSINWGRLLPQIVYYVSAYCDLVKAEKLKVGDLMNVVVPTGNFGNILAAWYAKTMGLPIGKLICASNTNNVLTEFIRMGVYNKNRDFVATISPSMDILISSNLERFLYDITEGDDIRIKHWMDELAQMGHYDVGCEVKAKIHEHFYAGYCDDNTTKDTIAKVWKEHSYLIDTHTAVGVHVYEQYKRETGDETLAIIASTANPFKFNQSVLEAITGKEEQVDEFELLSLLCAATDQKVPVALMELKDKPLRFDTKCSKEDMQTVVEAFLGSC